MTIYVKRLKLEIIDRSGRVNGKCSYRLGKPVELLADLFSISVPSPPKDITVSVSEEQATFKVHWNTPDEPNGKLTNYKICWRPFDRYRKYNWTCKTVKAHVLNDKISNVNESLRYVVKILAKNRAGEGKFSKPEIFLGGNLDVNERFPSFEILY